MSAMSRKAWVLLALGLVAVGGCAEDPTAPEEGTGTPSDELPADAPGLPVPAGPLADVPRTSDTLTVIAPLKTNFRPSVNRAVGDWQLRARECFGEIPPDNCGQWWPWESFAAADTWSDELGPVKLAITQSTVPMALAPPLTRILLVEDSEAVLPGVVSLTGSGRVGGELYETEQKLQPRQLTDQVHMRRDRFWEWVELSSGVGQYLLVNGNTEASLQTTYTSGTATTETVEMGRSVTTTAGVSFEALSLGVSTTITETYSTSVEVREESSETFTRTVRGSPGLQTRFMIWVLVERYSFTDADGRPFTDPSYDLVLDTLHRRGVATALQATDFDLP